MQLYQNGFHHILHVDIPGPNPIATPFYPPFPIASLFHLSLALAFLPATFGVGSSTSAGVDRMTPAHKHATEYTARVPFMPLTMAVGLNRVEAC